jgi:hypothetical protein
MHYRFITLAVLHRHGDIQPGEVGHVFPIARGEIQLQDTDELRAFCLVSGEMPDGDLLVGMSWPHQDFAVRAHEILAYEQLARAWTHTPLVETGEDGGIDVWLDLIQDLVDIVQLTSREEADACGKAFMAAFQRRLGLSFTETDRHPHPHER